MAIFLTVPVLLYTGIGSVLVDVTAWYPEPVWACKAVPEGRSLYFTCKGLDGDTIRFTVGGVNKA